MLVCGLVSCLAPDILYHQEIAFWSRFLSELGCCWTFSSRIPLELDLDHWGLPSSCCWDTFGGQAWFCYSWCMEIPARLPSSLTAGKPRMWYQRNNERLRKGTLFFLTDCLIQWEQLGSPMGFSCICFQQKVFLLTSWTKPYTSLRHKELEQLGISTCCSRCWCPCALNCC